MQAAAASVRGILGISSDDKRGDGLVYAVAAVLTGGVAVAVQGVGAGKRAAGGESVSKDRTEGEGKRLLQPIGGAKEAVAATEGKRHRILERWTYDKVGYDRIGSDQFESDRIG